MYYDEKIGGSWSGPAAELDLSLEIIFSTRKEEIGIIIIIIINNFTCFHKKISTDGQQEN